MRKVFLLTVMCIALLGSAIAQQSVSGTVVSESDGLGLPGVTISEKGTANGVLSDSNGKFSIKVASGKSTLVFSFIGMKTVDEPVNNRQIIDVKMKSEDIGIDEVVVTAMGISREKKALGYAMTEIKGSDIARINVVNPISGMQGKVAGVQINTGTGGPQSASRILIRGNTSLGTNNQPIFVVDGVIIDNTTTNNAEWGSVLDFGNDIKNLNSDDFETVSVLKGAAATALYGSRAANGVVLITTKKGQKSDGLGISLSRSQTWDDVYRFPDFQNKYGTGLFPAWSLDGNGNEVRSTTETANFGPIFDGKPYTRNGKEYIHSAKEDNVQQMYQTGKYENTNLALQGGDENRTFRFSFSNLRSNGTTLNNDFSRNSFSLNTTRKISSRVSADAGFAWVMSESQNPTFQGGGRSPIYDFMYSVPRDYDTGYWLQHYKSDKGDGFNGADPYGYSRNIWEYLENNYSQSENNLRANLNVDVKLQDWLVLKLKGDMNKLYTTYEQKILANGESNYVNSNYTVNEGKKDQYKITAMLNAFRQIGEINLNGTVALEQWDTRYAYHNTSSRNGLRIPGQFDMSNSVSDPTTSVKKNTDRKRINSAYAFVNMDYRGEVYLDITGRNDWSSSLIYANGDGNVSYFYPSVSSSWILSETFSEAFPEAISFAKVRGSYAIVGNDASPYLTSIGYYTLGGTFINPTNGTGYPYYNFDSNALRNQDLKPEKQHSIEFGAEMKFFNNRLGFDLAWYKTNTKNQILALSQAPETGVGSRWINAGDIQNKGVELSINATPLKTKDFAWDVTWNITRNQNEIIALAPGVDKYRIEGGGMDMFAYATVGGAYGDIYTPYAYTRDDKGNKVLNADGSWKRSGTTEKVGSLQPDFLSGMFSSIKYKNFSLNAVLDSRWGGDIASGTYNYGSGSGALAHTLYGRDTENGGLPRTLSDGRTINDGMIPEGVFGAGIKIGGKDVAGMTYQEAYNQGIVKPISAYQYYTNLHSWGTGIREEAVLDCSWVALREISFYWAVPKNWVNKAYVQGVNVGLVARNLGYLYNSLPDNIHPEGLSSNRSSAFVEIGGSAYTRSFGFNINVTF